MKICFVSLDKYKHISQEFGEEGFVNISINYINKYNVKYFYKYNIRIYILYLFRQVFWYDVIIKYHSYIFLVFGQTDFRNQNLFKFQLSSPEAGSQDPWNVRCKI